MVNKLSSSNACISLYVAAPQNNCSLCVICSLINTKEARGQLDEFNVRMAVYFERNIVSYQTMTPWKQKQSLPSVYDVQLRQLGSA